MRRMTLTLVAIVVGTALAVGCSSPAPAAQPTPAQPTAAQPTVAGPAAAQPTAAGPAATAAPAASPSLPVVDGAVADGEYAHTATVEDITIWWTNDATHLALAAQASGAGWVAVGLDPQNKMMGANIVFALMQGGQGVVIDAYGTAPTGNSHPDDVSLGGTNDIVAGVVVQDGEVLRFEAQIPLDSGDAYDKALQPGNSYPLIAAAGPAGGDASARHVVRGHGEIALDAAQ